MANRRIDRLAMPAKNKYVMMECKWRSKQEIVVASFIANTIKGESNSNHNAAKTKE